MVKYLWQEYFHGIWLLHFSFKSSLLFSTFTTYWWSAELCKNCSEKTNQILKITITSVKVKKINVSKKFQNNYLFEMYMIIERTKCAKHSFYFCECFFSRSYTTIFFISRFLLEPLAFCNITFIFNFGMSQWNKIFMRMSWINRFRYIT